MSRAYSGNPNRLRVLITGGTGLLGSHLVNAFLADEECNADVSVFSRSLNPASELVRSGAADRVRLFFGDLANKSDVAAAIERAKPQLIYHLGAQTQVGVALHRPLYNFGVNVAGTMYVLEAARLLAPDAHVVVASSDKAYGDHGNAPCDEGSALLGLHAYDASKVCADVLARSMRHEYGQDVAVVRCGNLFGGGDLNWDRLIPGSVMSLLAGKPVVIRGDGQSVREWVYVKDAADVYKRLGVGRYDGEWNLSYEVPIRTGDVVDRLKLAAGLQDATVHVWNDADVLENELRVQRIDGRKARERFGFPTGPAAVARIQEGLAETVEWYRGML